MDEFGEIVSNLRRIGAYAAKFDGAKTGAYNPTIGRYIQPDPLGLVDGANQFACTLSNPHRYVDKDGRYAQTLPFCVANPVLCALIITPPILYYFYKVISGSGGGGGGRNRSDMNKYSDEFIVKFDANEGQIKIWLVHDGQRKEPPLLLPFSKARVGGLDITSGFVGLKIVSRSPAMRELFGLDIDPDVPLKDQVD